MRTLIHNPRGLSLIELLAAVAISALLLSGAWRLLHMGLQSYQRGLQEVRVTQGARTVLTLMTRDVQRAMASRVPYGIRSMPSQPATPDGSRPRVDSLEMLIVPTLQESVKHAVPFSKEPQRLRYVPTPASQGLPVALQRATAVAESAYGEERRLVVHEHLQELSVRYFDGQHWHDAWQQPELPRALEIAVSVPGRSKQARAYRLTTLVTAE